MNRKSKIEKNNELRLTGRIFSQNVDAFAIPFVLRWLACADFVQEGGSHALVFLGTQEDENAKASFCTDCDFLVR